MIKWVTSSLLMLISLILVSTVDGSCPTIKANLTSPMNGNKAWDKCIEYQKLLFPCDEVKTVRENYCNHDQDVATVLLGYGATPGEAQWSCAGTLISDRFVLTAAHCLRTPQETVKFVRLGVRKPSENVDLTKTYSVARAIRHPDYKAPIKYNDIALLELDRAVKLDHNTLPACLHTGDPVTSDQAVEEGWPLRTKDTERNGLQKWNLSKFTEEECNVHYPPTRILAKGYQATTQLCYGQREENGEGCHGVSGSPLHVGSPAAQCMRTVLGFVIFGRDCSRAPTVYARVAAYLPWIESQVWP